VKATIASVPGVAQEEASWKPSSLKNVNSRPKLEGTGDALHRDPTGRKWSHGAANGALRGALVGRQGSEPGYHSRSLRTNSLDSLPPLGKTAIPPSSQI